MSNQIAVVGKSRVDFVYGGVYGQQREWHFSDVLFYKLVWIFTLGAFAGFLVETAWCFLRFGHFEMRSGFVVGPFNPVYGIGALAMYFLVSKVKRNGGGYLFFGGILIGTIVEYICSYVQERALGTVSWDYSGVPLNIGGRVCLLYSVFWGLLALLWANFLQPFFEGIIYRIPNSVGKTATWMVFLFFVGNAAVSVAAVARWMARMDAVPAGTTFGAWLDRFFHDSCMEYLYPNMIVWK